MFNVGKSNYMLMEFELAEIERERELGVLMNSSIKMSTQFATALKKKTLCCLVLLEGELLDHSSRERSPPRYVFLVPVFPCFESVMEQPQLFARCATLDGSLASSLEPLCVWSNWPI